jgi:hypothetical protein
MSSLTPLIFGVDLQATPPVFEILFLDADGDEYCVASVEFDRPVTTIDDAHRLAQRQLAKLSREDLRDLECTAAHLEQRKARKRSASLSMSRQRSNA